VYDTIISDDHITAEMAVATLHVILSLGAFAANELDVVFSGYQPR
jgi:hypothetical protein